MSKTLEGMVLKAVMDYLPARHILAFRMNTGTMAGEHKGKKWFVKFGVPGMADILAFQDQWYCPECDWSTTRCTCEWSRAALVPLWIEVKSEKGKQSDLQKSFQEQVESHGHRYVVVRSVEDVEAALK
jgi:heterodisulfide reductase subunit C